MPGGDMGLMRGSGSIPATPTVEAAPEPSVAQTPRGLLVQRAQAGDQEAFETLLERWLEPSLRTAYAIIGDEADARDATQDAFLRAWRELRKLRDPDRFDAWLSRILVNCCRTVRSDRRRTMVREIHLSVVAERDEPAAGDDPPGDGGPLSLDALERAFQRLPIDERSILVLHHLKHLPVSDIAVGLDIPVGTAKSRLFAARKALERALEAELR